MARSPSRTLQLTYLGDASQLRRTNDAAIGNVKTFGDRVKSFGKIAAGAFLAVGAAGIKLGQELFEAFEEANTANARVENLVNQLGNFEGQVERVTGRLIEQAEATARLTGVDRNLIKESQGILLTFASINETAGTVGGVFDRATQAAIDLSAAGFGTVDTAAIQLGKALEDPVRGLTALRRSGVTFTAEQEELIKSLVESNNVLAAQTLILEAIEGQVGGTAEATANGSDKIAQSFGILKETIGGALQPVFDTLVAKALEFVDRFATWWNENGDDVIRRFSEFATSVREARDAIREFATLVVANLRERGAFERLRRRGLEIKEAFDNVKTSFLALLDVISGGETSEKAATFAGFIDTFVIGPIDRAGGALTTFLELLDRLLKAWTSVGEAIDRIREGTFLDPLNDLGFAPGGPALPGSSQGFRPQPQAAPAPSRGVTINISGAVDPEGTARQVERIITGSARRVGVTGLAVIA